MSGTYAKGTEVTVDRSRAEIEKILTRYGADQFAVGWDTTRAVIGFEANGRKVRFVLPLPRLDEIPTHDRNYRSVPESQRRNRLDAEARRRWRALCLAIKAKLEVVETGIATFEDEFMAHIVMPDGRTVGEHVAPAIEQAYETGKVPPLLALEAGP